MTAVLSGASSLVKGLFDSNRKKKRASGVPTIDQARVNQIESDRIRKRRGSLANVFGGGQASTAPTVATKTLLGT